MSSFLLILARRAAGLPVGAVQAPAPMSSGPEVLAPDPDASDGGMELDPPRLESSAVAPAAVPTIGEAFTTPAIQRSPAMTELAPPALPSATPSTAIPNRAADTAVSAAAAKSRRPQTPAPLSERVAPVAIPASRPPRTEREPAHRAAPRSIVEPPVVAAVSEAEPSADDLPDVTARREESPLAPVAASVVPAPEGPRPIAPVTAQADQPRPVPLVRPTTGDSPVPLRLPRPALAAPPGAATPAPVHVRIGRIEVRGAPAPTPRQPSSQGAPATLGFAGYTRVRTYRNWPR